MPTTPLLNPFSFHTASPHFSPIIRRPSSPWYELRGPQHLHLPATNNNGDPIFLRDANGEVLRDTAGNPLRPWPRMVRHGIIATHRYDFDTDIEITVIWDTHDFVSALGQVGPVIGIPMTYWHEPSYAPYDNQCMGWGPVWDISQLGIGAMSNVFELPMQEVMFTPRARPPYHAYEYSHVAQQTMPVLSPTKTTYTPYPVNEIVMTVRPRDIIHVDVTWNGERVFSAIEPPPHLIPGFGIGARILEVAPPPGYPGWEWQGLAKGDWVDEDNPVPRAESRVAVEVLDWGIEGLGDDGLGGQARLGNPEE